MRVRSVTNIDGGMNMHKRTLRGSLGATAIVAGLLAGLPAMAAAQAAPTLPAAITPVPCSTASLISAINSAASGDTLVLASNCTYGISAPSVPSSSSEGAVGLPIINKVLTMVGGTNTTITRTSGTFRILEVAGSPTAGLTLRRITISNGKASGNLGGLKASGGCILAKFTGTPTPSTPTTLVLHDSAVENCTTGFAGNGGGIFLGSNTTARIIHSSVSDNTASASGGGIYQASDSSATIFGSRLTGNTANGLLLLDLGGGGIFVDGDATASIGASVLSDNSATLGLGGGIHVDGILDLVNTQLLGNSALAAGGGIYVDHGGLARVHSGLLIGNDALAGGGIYINGPSVAAPAASAAIDGTGGILRMTLSSMHDNEAVNGGGVYVDDGGIAVIGGSFLNHNSAGLLTSSAPNSAAINAKAPKANATNKLTLPGHGGALFNDGNTALSQDTLIGNHALLQGGGIYTDGRLLLVASLLQANRALISGGGVYADSDASTHFGAVQFQLNIALISGGAIFNDGHAFLQNSFVQGNIAPLGGGIFEARPLGMLVSNSLIFGNVLNNCRPVASVPLCSN